MPHKDPKAKAAQRLKDKERAWARAADPDSDIHGTISGYGAGCRCGRCKAAQAEYIATRRLQRGDQLREVTSAWKARRLDEMLANSDDPSHGTITGYGIGCRCHSCRDARAEQTHRLTYGYDVRAAN